MELGRGTEMFHVQTWTVIDMSGGKPERGGEHVLHMSVDPV